MRMEYKKLATYEKCIQSSCRKTWTEGRLGRAKHRQQYNIKMHRVGWGGVESTNSAEDRDQRNSKPSGKAGTILTSGRIINF